MSVTVTFYVSVNRYSFGGGSGEREMIQIVRLRRTRTGGQRWTDRFDFHFTAGQARSHTIPLSEKQLRKKR